MKLTALLNVFLLATTSLVTARRADPPANDASYLLVDAVTGHTLEVQWYEPDRPVPIGSLIKPFTALAFTRTHGISYPTFVCRGTADGCWLPAGHGRVGVADAIAGSCNAYFRQLAERVSPDALVSTLRWFGMQPEAHLVTQPAMVGLGDDVKIAPNALVRGYLELVERATQPGVSPIVQGMITSARTGTGRGVGAGIIGADALVKTGTAPCTHVPRAAADGYAIVVYPADRPRVALLVQAHGRTGAETARVAGTLLAGTTTTR